MSIDHIRKKVLLTLLAGSILHMPAVFAADANTENGESGSPNGSGSEVYGFDDGMDSYDLGTVVVTARREPLSELTDKATMRADRSRANSTSARSASATSSTRRSP